MKDFKNNLHKSQPIHNDPEKEYEELMKIAENAGISDLMKLYGEYRKLLDMSDKYLQQLNPKFSFSTTDSSV